MFIFPPRYGFVTGFNQLLMLVPATRKRAYPAMESSQSAYNRRIQGVTKSFWVTMELLAGPDNNPSYGRIMANEAIVQDYVEAIVFKATLPATMTYWSDRKRLQERRASLRAIEDQLRKHQLEPWLIRDHVVACLRKN